MPTLTMGSTARYTWLLDYTITQDVMTNESTIAYVLKIRRDVAAGSGSWWNGPNRTFTVTVDGTADAENTYAADFRVASPITFVTGSKVIAHNSDGTHSPVSVTTAVSGPAVSSNFPIPLSFTQSISLPTIPRAATSITRTSGTETGSSTTLALSPLVSSFYYVLKFKSPATGSWTTIGSGSGIAGSSWPYSTTIAHAQIPNAGSGTIQFQVTTLDSSGGTQIGSPAEASFTYTVPGSVMPTAAAPSLWEEGATTAGLSTITNSGAVFAQGWSKLKPTFASSPGTGASVVTDIVTVAGVSGNTTSGVAFANVVTSQGSGATFDVVVTDSRSRVDHETGTVSPAVHRWSLPVANAGSAVVTPTSTTQTIALSGLQAATTSFYLSGAQRNTLQTRVGYRDLTTGGAWSYGSWTTQALSTSDGTDNAYAPGSSVTVATGLDPTHEYEVTLQVRDVFGAAGTNYSTGVPYVESSILVPAQNVLIAYDGNTRMGIKKIPTHGALDVGGMIYQDRTGGSSVRVLDEDDNVTSLVSAATTSAAGKVELATDAETQTGTDATRAVTPASLSSRIDPLEALAIANLNRIINGDFRINQRNAASGAPLASSEYFLDRWQSGSGFNSITFDGDEFGRVVTVPASKVLRQRVEQINVPAGSYTLGHDGTAQMRLYKSGTTAPSFAAGPVTATLDGLANAIVEFGPGTVKNVRLLPGTKDYPFIPRMISEELALCQRYYWRMSFSSTTNHGIVDGWQVATTQARAGVQFPVTMRALPVVSYNTIRWTDAVTFDSGGITSISVVNTDAGLRDGLSFNVYWASAAGAISRPGLIKANGASSWIAFDAEI